jgi:hypothetical protein
MIFFRLVPGRPRPPAGCVRFFFFALVLLTSASHVDAQLLTIGVNLQAVAYDFANTGAAVDGGGAHITFASLAGKNYRLEYKNNVSDASWTLVGNNIPGLSGTTTALDPAAAGMARRFYRVLAIFPQA